MGLAGQMMFAGALPSGDEDKGVTNIPLFDAGLQSHFIFPHPSPRIALDQEPQVVAVRSSEKLLKTDTPEALSRRWTKRETTLRNPSHADCGGH